MAFFFIIGVRTSKLEKKSFFLNENCPHCNQKSHFVVQGEASYVHFFWIPIIPLPKIIHAKCVHCNKVFEKKDFPEALKKALKENKIRRPIWHLIAPVILLYKIVAALFFLGQIFVQDMLQEAEHKRNAEAEAEKVEERKQIYANDKSSVEFNPSLVTDSISYKIKQAFPFNEYDISADQVALFSKIEDKKILLLIDVKEKDKLVEARGCVLVSQIKNFLIHTYPEKRFDYFIGLYENNDLKLLHTPAEVYKTEYESPTPLYGFYADNWYYDKNDDVFKNKQEKLELFSKYGKKDLTPEKMNVAKEKKAWDKMSDKFKFGYGSRPASIDKRVLYECKFTLETGNVIPDELRRMFDLHDGKGPFLGWNVFYTKSRRVYNKYKHVTINELTRRDKVDEQLLPVYASPYWIPFYDDDTFSYAIDMLPSEQGHVGQIVLIKPMKKPTYVAKNMTEFLKLYREEKLPKLIEDWVR